MKTEKYDVIVVGAGHAGCEAALASSRLGCKTMLATLSLDNLALMPCNPSIGGPAKGHLVREIDALGGQMALSADRACLQMRMLNTGKGYAVQALRGQEDKPGYHHLMKAIVEKQDNLDLKQLMVDKLLVTNGQVWGVEAETGEIFEAPCVIVCTGTYLRGRIVYGSVNYESGPNGLRAANKFSISLIEHGVELMRFKTGTPARIDKRSIDFSKTEPQYGDEILHNFSYMNEVTERDQIPCFLSYTNERTHEIIRKNLHLSGMYNGMIEGVGPRYCPSIEAKIVRFADKDRHQLFIEPEGRNTTEMYIQGMSSSLPANVQLEFLRTIPGLENARMMRSGYAIDYDCLNPLQLQPSLEHKEIQGLYSAGQSNGTSGYEEAAAQGLIAGINAVRKIKKLPPVILRRDQAYIGVLIDDLVTKGTNEPYRMITSRAEYRLLLRQDNADLRLTELGREIGLVRDDRYSRFTAKRSGLERALTMLGTVKIAPHDEENAKLVAMGTMPLKEGTTALELLRRREIMYSNLQAAFALPLLDKSTTEQVEIYVKYQGYIEKQKAEVERALKLENKSIPQNFDYHSVKELSGEAMEKLDKIKPLNIGQAARISGVSPADINVLMVALEVKKYRKE